MLRWIFGIFAVLILIFLVGAYLLPREVTVQRSIAINAPAANIFPHLNAMQATAAWSPWSKRDPDMEVQFEGPESGVGNKMSWSSDMQDVGSGSQIITESNPNSRIVTALDFGDMGTATASFDLVELDGVTEVTWGLLSDMGNSPVGRWMGLMMDGWVGADYEEGLGNLKALVEGS